MKKNYPLCDNGYHRYGLLCYLGLSGYVWYYDKQRSKKAMCRPRLWVKIIKYWVISGEKDVIIVIRLPSDYLLFLLFRWQSS